MIYCFLYAVSALITAVLVSAWFFKEYGNDLPVTNGIIGFLCGLIWPIFLVGVVVGFLGKVIAGLMENV